MTDNALDEAKASGWVVESRPKTKAPRPRPAPLPAISRQPATNRMPASPLDIVTWLHAQDITPIPCRPKSKMPIAQISRRGVYGDGAPPGDSFHVPTPERAAAVKAWWSNTDFHRQASVADESISIDLHPGWNGDRQVIALDVDAARLRDAIENSPLLKQCPVITGRKGSKLLAILDDAGGRPEHPVTQYVSAEDPGHPALEIFSGVGRHVMVYGEHPASTANQPTRFAIERGFGEAFPVLAWGDIETVLAPVLQQYELVAKVASEDRQREPMQSAPTPTLACPRGGQTITDQLGLQITTVCTITDGVRIGDEIRGSHPVHGSTGKQNFMINPHKNTWHCFRCDKGGGPVEWIAVEGGIIDCSQSKPGCLDGHWPEVFDALRKRGYNPDTLISPGKRTGAPSFSSLTPEERYLRRVAYRRKVAAARRQEVST